MTSARVRFTALAALAGLCLSTTAAAVSGEPVQHVPHDGSGGPAVVPAAPAADRADAAIVNDLPRPFAAGDLFAATASGTLSWYGPDGTFVAELATGLTSIRHVAADPLGRLWALDAAQPATLVRIDATGAVTTISPVGATFVPWWLTFDALGNVFVGDWEIMGNVSKLSPNGAFLGAVIATESDYIDLAADQCTMYLQRPGWTMSTTERWNACTGTFVDVFHDSHTDDETANAVRLLPDGSVLMKNPDVIRVDQTAAVVRTYSFPECTLFWPESLSPSGGSFYAGCSGQGVYEVDVATGARVRALPFLRTPMTVMGGFRAAAAGAPPPADATPPTIDIDVPVDGGTITVGESVTVDYSCADSGGSGLASCAGPVPDGAILPLAAPGSHTFTVNASDGAGNTASATVHYEIAPPALSVGDATVGEGAGATVVVSLSVPQHVPVTVHYATANGTARQAFDYVRAAGTLTFVPGETSKTLALTTLPDALFELDETALINLSSPTNAAITDAQGVLTIVDDDPMPSLTVGDASRLEGPARTNSQLLFPVTLSAPSGVTSQVRLTTANGTATAGSDYGAKDVTLSIRAGSTTATVAVTVRGDDADEPDETFRLVATEPHHVTLADGEAVGTIVDDD